MSPLCAACVTKHMPDKGTCISHENSQKVKELKIICTLHHHVHPNSLNSGETLWLHCIFVLK